MIFRNSLFLLLVFAFSFNATGQCYNRNEVFKAGEDLSYQVFYNFGMFWFNAGHVYFRVHDDELNGRPVYHFDSFGGTNKEYDWFYKVRDHYQAWADTATLEPVKFLRKTSEGGYKARYEYLFNKESGKIFTFSENSDRPYWEDTLNMPDCIHDVLSLIYYARNIDFDKYSPGDKIPLKVITGAENFEVYIRFQGTEVKETHFGETYQCIKFNPYLVKGTIFQGGEDMTVWMTDDKNRIPVEVKAKILVGSIFATLQQAKGLRYPDKVSKVTP